MRVIIAKNYDTVSAKATEFVVAALKRKPGLVLGLATGSSPIGLYKGLIKAKNEGAVSFQQVKTFNLDEYVGLAPEHVQSYRYFMNQQLFDHVDIDKANTHVPDGLALNLTEFCQKYEQMIKDAGGVDVQVLGIGRDGHLGFNEPGSSLAGGTQVVTLFKDTIKDNARLFEKEEDVPRRAITMGIGTILQSHMALMVADGEHKADAVKGCVEGPVTAMCTASALQLHPNAVVIVDEAAASKLEHKDYYMWCEEAQAQLGD